MTILNLNELYQEQLYCSATMKLFGHRDVVTSWAVDQLTVFNQIDHRVTVE